MSHRNDERIFQIGTNSHGLAVAGGTGSWSWRFNGGHEAYSSVSLNTSALQAWVRQAGIKLSSLSVLLQRYRANQNIGAFRFICANKYSCYSNYCEKVLRQVIFSMLKISELIVLNDSSEISRKAIETYLARKWGLNYPNATSNGIFELETNGTLKTLVSLDREAAASYPSRD